MCALLGLRGLVTLLRCLAVAKGRATGDGRSEGGGGGAFSAAPSWWERYPYLALPWERYLGSGSSLLGSGSGSSLLGSGSSLLGS
eukprot:9162335-Pyramimonas_sp.AAC.1